MPNDELPPPIPNEAKMDWLSGMATVKADMTISPIIEETRAPKVAVNAWANLPDSSVRAALGTGLINIMDLIPTNDPTPARNVAPQGLAYAPTYKFMTARFASKCFETGKRMEKDSLICYDKTLKRAFSPESLTFAMNNAERIVHNLGCAKRQFNEGRFNELS